MQQGWIKLHRELQDKVIWKLSTPEQKVVLITIMLLANHATNEWEFAGERFKCEPGQFVTSLNSLADACGKGVSIQNVRTALTRFEKLDFLTNQSTKTGRLITVVNWGKYQEVEDKTNKGNNSELTKQSQSINKDLTPNKKDKKENNEKKYSSVPELETALHEFMDFRKKAKKPMTDNAVELLVKKLNEMSQDVQEQIEILNQSIMNGWTGVYGLKKENFSTNVKPVNTGMAEEEKDMLDDLF